jgi:hypothetical protein
MDFDAMATMLAEVTPVAQQLEQARDRAFRVQVRSG